MSLLRELQQLTERTYQQTSGINLEKFIIGRRRFKDLSKISPPESLQLSDAARVFFRVLEGRLHLAVYFSEFIIANLEKNDPRRGLHEGNIYPFMVFIEEINHGVHAALKYLSGEKDIQREDFIRDLELLAKIDTYQILKFFLAYFNASKKLENFDRLWLRHHLFERVAFSYDSPRLKARYRETNFLGQKYVRFLDGISPHYRVNEIRRFREMNYAMKVHYIRLLPA
ncbi:MAG: hypothetical protein ACE5G1_07370 [bacterium]